MAVTIDRVTVVETADDDMVDLQVWNGRISMLVRDSCWDSATVHFRPDEARQLAQHLIAMADATANGEASG